MTKRDLRMLSLLLASFLTGVVAYSQEITRKPNIIVIVADDLGWNDLGCYGSSFYETPNLDSLATQGIRFTCAYSNSPVCSPSRASLLTGKYPVKTGVTDWIKGRQEDGKAKSFEKLIGKKTAYNLGPQETTIAEYALSQRYRTFFAGKWHLGEEENHWPEYEGFQINKGGWSKGGPSGKLNDSTGGFFTPYQNPRLIDGPEGEYLTDRLATECINFIDASLKENFLLVFSLYAVHNPLQAPQDLIQKYEAKKKKLGLSENDRFVKDEGWMMYEKGWRRRVVQDNAVYAAMVERMDMNIGRILQKLKKSGLDQNTLIIFTSDNGGLSTAEGSPTMNGPLRNGKGWLYEGGIRVPLIMVWKGKLLPGTLSDVPVSLADLYPTIANAINADYKKDKAIDGLNILSLISDVNKFSKRSLYWHYPHYSNQGGKPGSALFKNNFKLIYNHEDKSVELYNLRNDLGERNNLSRSHLSKTKSMRNQLMRWLRSNEALFPDLNPAHNAQ